MRFSTVLRWWVTLALFVSVCDLPAQDDVVKKVVDKNDTAVAPAEPDTVELRKKPNEKVPYDGEESVSKETSAEENPEEDASAEEQGLVWLTDLDKAQRLAQTAGKPMLIRVAADWCPACRVLAKAIGESDVQSELAQWVLVNIDVTAGPTDIKELQTEAIPALIIRTPSGRRVASQIGVQSEEQLLAWLKKHYEAAVDDPDEVLFDEAEPNVMAVIKLVRQFGDRNPTVREAAIRRLMAHPDVSRTAVVKTFREGSLSSRLAALEVLGEWKAPVQGMDPWQPDTLGTEAIARLEEWAEEAAGKESPTETPKEKPDAPKPLSEDKLADARTEIDRMLKATATETEAIAERLARLGPALMPEVYARLKKTETDADRERLLMLRYRLVASDALVLQWPGGLARLAATDSRQRQKAAEQLAKRATHRDQALLLELFSDPDPLVREISLRGLQQIGGKQSTAALIRLLSDPEPNVRAAVLKLLEESGSSPFQVGNAAGLPKPTLVLEVAKYLKKEKDPDLIVHAIRFLRAAKNPVAVKSLMELLEHESWQVRAESAAAIGELNRNYGGSSDAGTKRQAEIYVALIELLNDSDAFVVAQAVKGLSRVDMGVAVEPLMKAARRHPDLAGSVITILARGKKMRKLALPQLREFCKDEDPLIRAEAIRGLATAAPDAMEEELLAALKDTDGKVRIAAASTLFRMFESSRDAAYNNLARSTIRPNHYFIAREPVLVEPEEGVMTKALKFLANAAKTASKGAKPADKKPDNEKPVDEKPADEKPDDEKPGDKKEGDDIPSAKEVQPPEVAPAGASAPAAGPPKLERIPVAGEPVVVEDVVVERLDEPSDVATAVASTEGHGSAWDEWLEKWYSGKGRLKWTEKAIGPLQEMLEADDPEERMAAALALVPLGQVDLAVPVIEELARTNLELVDNVREVFPWLVWKARLGLFERLQENEATENDPQLILAMSEVADRRATEKFWELLADKELTRELASSLYMGLSASYFGSRYHSSDEVRPSQRKAVLRDAKPRAIAGSDLQRITALTLVAAVSPDEAAEIAGQLAEETKLSDEARSVAFQIRMVTLTRKEGMQAAIDALNGENKSRRRIALDYLIKGPAGLQRMADGYYLPLNNLASFVETHTGATPIIPKPPRGLKAEHVRPLIDDEDPRTAAYAGYLLVLCGEPEGLGPLLRYWRTLKNRDWDDNQLVVRAIASLDDSTNIAVLRKVYGEMEEYRMDEFYWTIRIMSGPEILKFRKQIREEVGMSRLR